MSLSCRPFVVITTFSTGLVDVEVASQVRIYLPLFSTVVPFNICMFLSCRSFVVITTLSTGLVGVENVVITKNGLQDRNIHIY